jgi:CheY-like chemotaxis protein
VATATELRPFAIVIEPRPALAELVGEVLQRWGYEVSVASTHVGAAQVAQRTGRVDLAIAAVPAPGEDRTGAYLEEAARQNPTMCMVVMLSDPNEVPRGAPAEVERVVKPFTVLELQEAVQRAIARCWGAANPLQ